MRPIKFRAWDKEDIQMRDVLAVNFYHRVLSVEYEGDQFVQDGMNRFILMQSTGLLEKDGVEIYEGDIVAYIDKHGQKRIGKINYANAKYYIGNFETLGYAGKRYELEVIGNKYENPELLKEQNK